MLSGQSTFPEASLCVEEVWHSSYIVGMPTHRERECGGDKFDNITPRVTLLIMTRRRFVTLTLAKAIPMILQPSRTCRLVQPPGDWIL